MKLLLFIVLLFLTSNSFSEVAYKCFDKNGHIIFSDELCSNQAIKITINAPAVITSTKQNRYRQNYAVKNANSKANNNLSQFNPMRKEKKKLNALYREKSSLEYDIEHKNYTFLSAGELQTRLRQVKIEIKYLEDKINNYSSQQQKSISFGK
jgi:selenophosphate synthase